MLKLLGNDFINEIYRETFNGTKIVRLFKNQIVFKHTIFNTMRFYFVKKNLMVFQVWNMKVFSGLRVKWVLINLLTSNSFINRPALKAAIIHAHMF